MGNKLEMDVPEILCELGLKNDAKVMNKAHDEMIEKKKGILNVTAAPPNYIKRTPEQEKAFKEYQRKCLHSSFCDADYRATAKDYLCKVLSKVEPKTGSLEEAYKDALEKYKAAAAEFENCRQELEQRKLEKNTFNRQINLAVIRPFEYAHSGANMLNNPAMFSTPGLHDIGRLCVLYPEQRPMLTDDSVKDPVSHIKYMLAYIETLNEEER